MKNKVNIKNVKSIVVRFSGDSGDGMQLTGTIFSNLSAVFGNEIATFPDYPAEIRAPQGTLSGVSGYQVHLGSEVYNSGEKTDVLVAMNPAALKVNAQHLKKDSIVIIDTDSFAKKDLEKAMFITDDPMAELGLASTKTIAVPITTLTRDSLEGFDMDIKTRTRCKNMFALGLVCWLFDRPLDEANHLLSTKFSKRPLLVEANLKVLADGYNYGHNQDMTALVYRVDTVDVEKGYYLDVKGNDATAYGLVAASERSGKPLFLASYPITPATDILHELSRLKQLGIKVVQAEDEIAAVCASIGASFAGSLAVTTTSGPGLALKGEAIGLAIMAELPLVVVNVQRSGPSTGLPTKSEQTDLRQALYGRNGESPVVVMAAATPTHCFDMAYWAAKIALEHITPVILLTDGYIANGSSAWRMPQLDTYPAISPMDQTQYKGKIEDWSMALRDEKTLARYWVGAGIKGFTHRIGGLERDYNTGAISTSHDNHQKMVNTRQEKIDTIAKYIPNVEVVGDPNADLLVVGWGGTYGYLREAVDKMNKEGMKVALAHFTFISPLPKNTKELLLKFKKIIVAEQNNGQFADYLTSKIAGLQVSKYNKVEGQPFSVSDLINTFTKEIEGGKK